MSGWRFTKVHHVGMTVSDIERSIVFYRDRLGLELVGRRPNVEEGYIERQTGYAGVRLSVASFRVNSACPVSLELVEYLTQGDRPAETATNMPGNTHLCLVVDDLQGAYEELKQSGVRFRSEPVEITAGPNQGGKVIYLYDPDNYVVEMFQPPSGA